MSLLNPSELIDKFDNDIVAEVVYTSTTSNIHSLYAALVEKSVDNAYISKVGDILNVDTHYKGPNSAVYSENNAVFTVSNSTIKTDGVGADATVAFNNGKIVLDSVDVLTLNDLSAGLLVSNNSSVEVSQVSLYTLGTDSNAVYLISSSNAEINESYIGADNSDVIYSEDSNTISIHDSIIFNNQNYNALYENGLGTGHIVADFDNTTFDMVSSIATIKDTSDEINIITLTNSELVCPKEDKFAFNFENADSNLVFNNAFLTTDPDAHGGNLVNAVNSKINIDATKSNLEGYITGDSDSEIFVDLGNSNTNCIFTGAVNAEHAKVKLTNAKWILTENTYISELDIDYISIINKNGHILLVDGEDYTDGIVVGSVVNYTTKAEKVYDREVLEKNCIVIKKITNEDNANEFILYDADDRLAYKAVYSEFRYTGKDVDITPILNEIEDLLIGIDEYYSDTTIRTKDENTNAIIINGKTYSLDNIIVEKYNGPADEERGLIGQNAAIYLDGEAELNLTNSTVVSSGEYAPGIYVTDKSKLNLENVQINTQNIFSPGVVAMNDSIADISESDISTIASNSEVVKIYNGASVTTRESNLIATGTSSTVFITNDVISDVMDPTEQTTTYIDSRSTFNSEGDYIIHVQAKDTTEDAAININLTDSNINTDNANTTLKSLIKCSGENKSDLININLEGTTLINPPSSLAFIHLDPVTVNLELDSSTSFEQFNENGYLFKVDDNSILNINATGSTIYGQIKLSESAAVNLRLVNGIFNGVFDPNEEIGNIKVKLVDSVWNLSSDDYISELDIDTNSTIYTNDYNLYINGKIYNPVTDVNDQYQEIELPTGRVLKVLTSNEYSELTNKQDSYIYFLYDKLEMWFEHSEFVTPFCLVEKMPETNDTLVPDILYINYTTGKIFIYNDYNLKEVGYVEHVPGGKSDPAQLAILAAAGTTYFQNAESRYIDVQTRTIILPYQNGSYQICVNIPEDLKITEDTVVYYNPETEQWEMDGYRTSSEFEIPYYNNIKPANSSTVLTEILNKHIVRSELRISRQPNNMIDTMINGIYVDGNKYATAEECEVLKNTVIQYRAISDNYIIQLRDAIEQAIGHTSDDVINDKIMSVLQEYESTIDTMVQEYDSMYSRLISAEEAAQHSALEAVNNAKAEIMEYLESLSEEDPSETDP